MDLMFCEYWNLTPGTDRTTETNHHDSILVNDPTMSLMTSTIFRFFSARAAPEADNVRAGEEGRAGSRQAHSAILAIREEEFAPCICGRH
jgi:hypothetical protein